MLKIKNITVMYFGSGVNPPSYSVGAEVFRSRINRPGREVDHNIDGTIHAIPLLHKDNSHFGSNGSWITHNRIGL
jgi:hypothetical protein